MENLTEEENNLFDKLLKIIRDENSKEQLKQLLNLIENGTIQQSLDNITNINAAYNGSDNQMSVEKMVDDIKKTQSNINEIYRQVFDTQDGNDFKSSALKTIEEAKQYADKMQSDYMKFYNQQDSQGNVTEGIISKLETACKNIEEHKDKIEKTINFYNKIFIGEEVNENNTHNPPLEQFLNEKKEAIEQLIINNENKFKELYDTKSNDINSLLPGATSAGLAAGYTKEKKEIMKNVNLWNRAFVVSILTFIVVFGFYFYLSFHEDFTYISFLKALPLWVFSGFFTYYSTKQIAEYKRIASEYAHKQRLNQTYKGYEAQIKETNDEKLKQQLLKIMLDSAELNPSKTLGGKGEIPSLSVLEKIVNMLPFDELQNLYSTIGKKINKEQENK